jgi:hypothetical protein
MAVAIRRFEMSANIDSEVRRGLVEKRNQIDHGGKTPRKQNGIAAGFEDRSA